NFRSFIFNTYKITWKKCACMHCTAYLHALPDLRVAADVCGTVFLLSVAVRDRRFEAHCFVPEANRNRSRRDANVLSLVDYGGEVALSLGRLLPHLFIELQHSSEAVHDPSGFVTNAPQLNNLRNKRLFSMLCHF